MNKWGKIVICILCSLVVLLACAYCVARFSFGIDVLDRSGWHIRDGQTQYLDYYGRPLLQWQNIEGKQYYFDPDTGNTVTGWLEHGTKRYYLDESGAAVTGWTELEDKRYYFDESGAAAAGWLEQADKRYYLDASGAAVTGWLELENKRYYLDETGAAVTGWLKLENATYYLDALGTPMTGWLDTVDGRCCFDETGRMLTGWAELDGSRYFFGENGRMATGWLEHEGDRYYLREDGTMAVGQVEIDGVSNFFTSTGKYVVLVNRWNLMPEDYQPELVDLDGFLIDASCRDALEQMILDCREAGYRCVINNTYRSLATQQYMWDVRLETRMAAGMSYEEAVEYTGRSLAFVGASEHHLGLAVDINGSDAMYEWLEENCWDYGFILRYPPDRFESTGIIYEPWHFRYVGTELAKELQALGLCMEEYMQGLTESQQT